MSQEQSAVPVEESRFRIGELARRVGATPRTVRYYEELGLLPDRGRPEGAHRLYDQEDELRLAELIRVRDLLGLSLAELGDWMEAEAARAALREPSRSRRPRMVPWEIGKRCSARSRRTSWPRTTRSSLARGAVSALVATGRL